MDTNGANSKQAHGMNIDLFMMVTQIKGKSLVVALDQVQTHIIFQLIKLTTEKGWVWV